MSKAISIIILYQPDIQQQQNTKFQDLLKTAKELIEDKGFIIVNTYSPKLDGKKIKDIASSVFNQQKVSVTRLSMKTTTGKRLDFGELTRIQF